MLLRLRANKEGSAARRPGREPVPLRSLASMAPTMQAGLSVGLHYELAVDSFFGASHSMRPEGEVHTHSFRLQATFIADAVDDQGMMVGFREVNQMLEFEAKRYSNRYLNDLEPFTIIQPTGENIAAVIYRNLHVGIAETMPFGPRLVAVTLWENPTSYVRVGGGQER